jgi:DNA polymerase-3 subunit delta'
VSFDDHAQRRAIARQLQRSLERGRLAHAYLFAGPRGSGTRELAGTLAKALNCETREHDSCDRCETCRRIDAEKYPDVYWVRPESKSRRITVEQVREFESAVNLKPSEARVKVGIIVDADCMGEEASNAFLKTLEEPPAQTIIILLTAEPQRLLPTILSRCLKISFGPTGNSAASPERARVFAALAQLTGRRDERVAGSYQLLADISAILKELRESVRARVETEDNLDRYDELDAKTRDRLEAQQEARIEGEYRAARERVLEDIYEWFGDLLLCVAGADAKLLSHRDAERSLQLAAQGVSYEQATGWLDAIGEIRESLQRNIGETLALEVGFLKLAAPGPRAAAMPAS